MIATYGAMEVRRTGAVKWIGREVEHPEAKIIVGHNNPIGLCRFDIRRCCSVPLILVEVSLGNTAQIAVDKQTHNGDKANS